MRFQYNFFAREQRKRTQPEIRVSFCCCRRRQNEKKEPPSGKQQRSGKLRYFLENLRQMRLCGSSHLEVCKRNLWQNKQVCLAFREVLMFLQRKRGHASSQQGFTIKRCTLLYSTAQVFIRCKKRPILLVYLAKIAYLAHALRSVALPHGFNFPRFLLSNPFRRHKKPTSLPSFHYTRQTQTHSVVRSKMIFHRRSISSDTY